MGSTHVELEALPRQRLTRTVAVVCDVGDERHAVPLRRVREPSEADMIFDDALSLIAALPELKRRELSVRLVSTTDLPPPTIRLAVMTLCISCLTTDDRLDRFLWAWASKNRTSRGLSACHVETVEPGCRCDACDPNRNFFEAGGLQWTGMRSGRWSGA
jgi:hypothetical protein